jgi:hypothetical protein
MGRQIVHRIGAVASVMVALVLAHDLVFLVRYGSVYGEELAHFGHGPAWTGAVVGSLAIGAGLLAAGLFSLYRLRRLASSVGARPTTIEPRWRVFIRSWIVLSARLAVLTVGLLTVQENVERMGIGLPGPNVGILLSRDYPFAPAIVLAIAVAVAFVVALLKWRHDVLVARIHAARRPSIRPTRAPRPAGAPDLRPQTFIRGRLAVRAPPAALVISARA